MNWDLSIMGTPLASRKRLSAESSNRLGPVISEEADRASGPLLKAFLSSLCHVRGHGLDDLGGSHLPNDIDDGIWEIGLGQECDLF